MGFIFDLPYAGENAGYGPVVCHPQLGFLVTASEERRCHYHRIIITQLEMLIYGEMVFVADPRGTLKIFWNLELYDSIDISIIRDTSHPVTLSFKSHDAISHPRQV